MKIKRFLLSLLVILCSSCQGNEIVETKNEFLSEFSATKIVYNEESIKNAKTIAVDLQEAIKEKFSVNIPIEQGTTDQEKAINIGMSENIEKNKYQIKALKDRYLLNANDKYGLLEACRYFLENVNQTALSRQAIINKDMETVSSPFKIMSYNLRNCDDSSSTFPDGAITSNKVADRAPRVAKNILDYMPDSVGVQEGTVSTWGKQLGDLLFPTYGYVGFGREAGLGGEACGIYYNRQKLVLIEANTKWYSETPDVAGSQYTKMTKVSSGYNDVTNTQDKWQRVFTYAIFKRISDGKYYMQINSHFDLATGANLQNAIDELNFANNYMEQMPVFFTADYNAYENAPYFNEKTKIYEPQGVNYLISQGLKSAKTYADITSEHHTWPVHYYGSKTLANVDDCQIIDYIFSSKGVMFDEYKVLTEPVKAGNDTHAGCSSDHYPICAEGQFVEPLVSFKSPYKNVDKDIMANNEFVVYDAKFNEVANKSSYSNKLVIDSIDSNVVTVNGAAKPAATVQHDTFAPNGCMGWVSSGTSITYAFNSPCDTTGDIDLVISRYRSRTAPLSDVCTLDINNQQIDLTEIYMPYTDTNFYYEWHQLVIKNVSIKQGSNFVKMTRKASGSVGLPNQLMMNVFSNENLNIIAAK